MRIDHINIVTANLKKSKEFYVNIIGLEEVLELDLEGQWLESITNYKKAKAKCVFLQPDSKNCRIELLQYENPKTLKTNISQSQQLNYEGIRHIAFEVDNIDEIYQKALINDIEFISKPIKVPLEIVPSGKTLCYMKAPDGVVLELAQYDKKS